MSFLTNVLGTLIKQVAKRNQKNDAVKTADPVVFNDIQKKIENVHATPSAEKSQADILKDYFEQVRAAQVENEASPTVETADKSVYEDLVQEIEKLKSQVQNQNTRQPNLEMPSPKAPELVMAWNSTGGTIETRNEPNMGADRTTLRIPNKATFSVLDYSENSINLDGQQSRFVLVESNGQKGWILENYLNFN